LSFLGWQVVVSLALWTWMGFVTDCFGRSKLYDFRGRTVRSFSAITESFEILALGNLPQGSQKTCCVKPKWHKDTMNGCLEDKPCWEYSEQSHQIISTQVSMWLQSLWDTCVITSLPYCGQSTNRNARNSNKKSMF
jgi:hypothetical protein